jgi:hypothetical protein
MSLDPITPESLYQRLLQSVSHHTHKPKPTPTPTHTLIPTSQLLQKEESSESLYLSTIEWKNINYILNHNDSTPELRDKVKNIIYNCYESWAFSMVSIVKQKHWEKCESIQLDELKLYGYIGLRKALINYDSTKYNIFTNYAVKYIYSEVLSGIYELSPMYASDGNYKYKKKQKIMNRQKRNETRRQKDRLSNHNNPDEPTRILRKKMAVEIE